MVNFHPFWRYSKNIKARLTFAQTGFFSIILFFVLSYWYLYTRNMLFHEAVSFLKHEAQEIRARLSETELEPELEAWIRSEITDNSDYSMGFVIFNGEGKLLTSYKPPELAELLIQLRRKHNDLSTGVAYEEWKSESQFGWGKKKIGIGYALVRSAEGKIVYEILVFSHFDFVYQKLHSYRKRILVAVPLVFLISLLLGFIATTLAFLPVRKMIQRIETITARRLNERIPLRESGDDLDRLADTFNSMMDRIKASYDQISRFTSDISHELKTPLSVMKTEIEVTLTQPRPLKEYEDVLADQLEHLTYLSDLVEHMLLLARSERQVEGEKKVSINVKEMIETICDFLEPIIESQQIQLRVLIDRNLFFLGEPILIRQAFFNLIENAVRYNQKGGTIEVQAGRLDNKIQIRIRDTGIGIPESEQSRIFDRFYRFSTDPSSQRGHHHGLGLAICKAIVESHLGTIQLESRLNEGSIFTLSFPAP